MNKFMLAIAMTVLLAVSVFAQSNTGRLVGTVSSPDGFLAGASVTLRDNQTGKEFAVVTTETGNFSFSALSVGEYTLTIKASGFKTSVSEKVKIDIGREYSIDKVLELGGVAESITVTSGADVVNSTSAELSSTVSPRQILELPLNGRNPLSLIGLQAGASSNRGNGSEIINGGRTSSTNFTRDGLNVQDAFIRNGFVTDTPTVDNTGEFTVVTGNAGAEVGYGASQVQLSTPRGGKDFHGALFAYNRNSRFTANNFFNNAAGRFTATDTAVIQGRSATGDLRTPRPFLNRNQFGGKFSGPLPLPNFGEGGPEFLKNKGFFFFSTERFILRQQTTKTVTILTEDARNGIFSYRPTTVPTAGQCITFNNNICRVNILNGAGLGAAIPATSQGILALDSTISSRFLSRIPTAGNRPDLGDGLNTTGLTFNQSDPENRREYTTRIDIEVNQRNSVNGAFRFNQTDDARTDIDTTFNKTASAKTAGPTKFLSLGWVSSISNNFTNELRGGRQFAKVQFINDVLPQQAFLLAGSVLATHPELNFRNQGRNVTTVGLQDNATYVAGKHSIRFGGDMQRYKVLSFNFANVGVPTYAITTTGNPNTPALPTTAGFFPGTISAADRATANNLRYFLAGIVGSGNVAANVTSRNATSYTAGARLDRNLSYNTFAGYVSDQWRVSSNLTLNLGLRYEYYTPLHSVDGTYLEPVLGSNPVNDILNPTGSYQFIGGNAGKSGDFAKADRNNFGPTASFAYTPSGKGFLRYLFGSEGKTVIRGGVRVGYVNDEYIRSQDNANTNNAGLSATANALTGGVLTGSTFLNDRFSALSPPVAPTFIVPPRTYIDNNTAAFAGRFGTVSGIDPNLQVQKEIEYNFGIQREIGFDTVLEVRYVGTRSNQLTRSIDYNQIDIRSNGFAADFIRATNNLALGATYNCSVAFNGCQPLSVVPNLTAAGQSVFASQLNLGTPADTALTLIQGGNTGTVRFLANPNTGVANYTTNGGLYRYNSLQTELRRRFTKGLALQANYTLQKILTNVADDGINQTRVSPFLDNENKGLEYSRPSFDTAQSFNLNLIYELPFGKGKTFFNNGGVINQIFGGWQIGSIVQWNSGAPILFSDARGTLNRAGRAGNQTAFSSLTNEQINALLGYRNVNGTLYYIDPAIISSSGRAANGYNFNGQTPFFAGQVFFNVKPGETGNVARYALNGPQFWNWDANVIKNFRITETTRLQVRAEAFNVTNSTRFGTPTFNINSASFGRLTGAFSPRIMQFAARFEF